MGKFKFSRAARIGGFLAAAAALALSALAAPLVHANGSSFSGSGGGTVNDPYLVTSCAQFQDINNNDDGYNGFDKAYRLTQNLNCNSTGNAIMADGAFGGSFDGDGHSISVQLTGADQYIGLFKNINGGTVTDLTINGSVVAHEGAGEVGMLAGIIQNGATISGVTVNANISNPAGANTIGGIAGYNVTSTVTDSVVTGSVTSGGSSVGGFFGASVCMSNISDSHSSAMVYSGSDFVGGIAGNDGCEGPGTTYDNVYSTGSVTGRNNVGGIVGNAPASTITDSHSTGDITGNNGVGGIVGSAQYGTSISQSYATGLIDGEDNVGGVAGVLENSSNISQSYATGTVESSGLAGGIVAYIDSGSSVSDSYARGEVSAAEMAGGAVGSINSGTVERIYSTGAVGGDGAQGLGGLAGHDGAGVSNNGLFWDAQSSGLGESAIGTGKSTAQMKNINTFTSLATHNLGAPWDFVGHQNDDAGNDDIWGLTSDVNDGYPCLTWQDDCGFGGSVDPPASDDDDIDPEVEADAPNDGDGNDDGTADNAQGNVSSFVNSVTGEYVTIEAPVACSLSSLSAAAESSNTSADGSYSYPNGLVNFTADCGTPGYTANLKVFTYGSSDDYVLRKYNSVTHTYANVPGATLSQQTIGGQTVTVANYSITDGGALDEDGTANGTIVDPVGLAIAGNVTSTPQSGGSNSANAAGAGSNSAAANGSGTLADTGQPAIIAAVAALVLIGSAIGTHRMIAVRARNK